MKQNITITASLFSASPKSYRWLYAAIALLLMLITSVDSNAQSKDRDNPTQLTSSEISGLIDSESKGNFYYYTFMANPGEVTITLSVESNPPLNTSRSVMETVNAVSFTLFDRNAVAIAEKKAATFYGDGAGQAVARVNITRRQRVVLGINIHNELYASSSGKYRLRIGGAVDVGKGIDGLDSAVEAALRARRRTDKTDNLECLPKQGTLILKMKDGSKKIIDLSEAETVTIVP